MAHRIAEPNTGLLSRNATRRRDFAKVRRVAAPKAGLALATLAVAPLLAFAVLWTSLLLILGGGWVLHALHLI